MMKQLVPFKVAESIIHSSLISLTGVFTGNHKNIRIKLMINEPLSASLNFIAEAEATEMLCEDGRASLK